MPRHFSGGGRTIVSAQPEPSLRHQHDGQRARDKQRVVEPILEERGLHSRFHPPAIQRIQGARGEKQRIANISERLHNNARITRPKPSPNRIFSSSSILLHLTDAPPLRKARGRRGESVKGAPQRRGGEEPHWVVCCSLRLSVSAVIRNHLHYAKTVLILQQFPAWQNRSEIGY